MKDMREEKGGRDKPDCKRIVKWHIGISKKRGEGGSLEMQKTNSPWLIFCFLCSNVFTLCCQQVITQSMASDWLAKNASLISGLIFYPHPHPQSAVTFLPTCTGWERKRRTKYRSLPGILNFKWGRQATLPSSWQVLGPGLANSIWWSLQQLLKGMWWAVLFPFKGFFYHLGLTLS